MIDPSTGEVAFNPDAATFGLKDLPQGGLTFLGTESDKLFGIIGNAKLDFQNLNGTATGNFNITGGEGRFAGATGIFTFLENDTLNADPLAPFKSQAVLSGSFEAVPEPGAEIGTLVAIGVIGAGFILHRRSL